MAVAYSTKTSISQIESGLNDGPITDTTAITENGSNVFLVVSVTLWPGWGNNISDDTPFVSGVTCDGNALSLLMTITRGGSEMNIYYRAGAIGTNKNVVVTYEDSDNSGLGFTSVTNIVTYTGVAQGSPIVESTSVTGLSRNPDGTLTSDAADNCIVDCTVIAKGGTSYTLTEDGAGTNRYMSLIGTTGSTHFGCTSDVTGAGAKTMSYNISGVTNKNWAMGLFELAAAVDASPPQRMRTGWGL
jgi:hypothetical protein